VTPIEIAAIVAAGMAAGTVNTIVGSGSLITFPALLALGYAPVVANVSNTVGLLPGSVSGAVGYRRELSGQGGRVLRLGIAAGLGALTGAMLLLILPAAAFERVVPFLLLGAVLLIALQPRLSRAMAHRRGQGRASHAAAAGHDLPGGNLRWLLRCGAGSHPDRPAGHLPRGRPSAPQRAQERADPWSSTAWRHCSSSWSPRWSGRWRCCSPRARSWGARSARCSGDDCHRCWLRIVIVVVGTLVGLKLLIG